MISSGSAVHILTREFFLAKFLWSWMETFDKRVFRSSSTDALDGTPALRAPGNQPFWLPEQLLRMSRVTVLLEDERPSAPAIYSMHSSSIFCISLTQGFPNFSIPQPTKIFEIKKQLTFSWILIKILIRTKLRKITILIYSTTVKCLTTNIYG